MDHHSTAKEIIFPESIPIDVDTESYLHFLEKACHSPSVNWIVVSFPFPAQDLLKWFNTFNEQYPFQFYWEKPTAQKSIAAVGSVYNLSSKGPQRFDDIRRSITDFTSKTLHIDISTGQEISNTYLIGGFSFFDEIKQQSSWNGFAPASFRLPAFTLVQDGNQTTASIAIALDKNHPPEELHKVISKKITHLCSVQNINSHKFQPVETPDKNTPSAQNRGAYKKWTQLILDAKQTIADEKLNKVVLGRQLHLETPQNYNAIATVHNLRSHYPNCSTFLVKNKTSGTFIGCSPEQLLSVNNNHIKTEALAGSIARGATEKQDKEWASKLLNSFKDHEEHTYVVSDIKRLLKPFVASIESTRQPVIKKLANVQHLYSPIQGVIQNDEHPISILSQLHPTPAVGGTPRNQALQYIQEKEPFNRGWFASPVGWITTGGEAKFTVAIRSGLINKKRALLFAGCGIVANSNPETEWQETNLKFMPMLSALNYD